MLNATKTLKIQLKVNVPGLPVSLWVDAPAMRPHVDFVSLRPSARLRAHY